MNAIKRLVSQFLRGRGVSRLLEIAGIDSRRYWLLVDLFGTLSERREMFTELGRDGVALKTATATYFLFASVGSLIAAFAFHPRLSTYFATFMILTGLLLLGILLPETSNSLVNPVEGLVLAHQPIDGATYTAAKLTHLLRIVLYLVPGMNLVAAFAGLALTEAGWLYPIYHLLAAFVVGMLAALLSCAVFGWLIRIVPPTRLRSVGQVAEILPLATILFFQYGVAAAERFTQAHPFSAASLKYLLVAAGVAAVAIVVFGLRALSGDYLIKVSSIAASGSAAKARERKSRLGRLVASIFGGQESRAGFEYVARTFLRDWQFRRQVLPLLVMLIPLLVFLRRLPDVFARGFSPAHVIPHFFGFLLFMVCNALPCGNNYECGWFFLLAPSRAFARFTRGVYAFLWIELIVIPHLFLFAFLIWRWGLVDAALFIAYSLALASAYLGLELRRIEALPFTKQYDPKQGALLMPIMMAGGLAMAILVGIQYALIFRSRTAVALATLLFGGLAILLARNSLHAFAASIRYNLGLLAAESGTLYKEV